ncbi:hypothetical protein MPSEU_001042800 [Mayamaea pseudoterrestris]|nr:hypothetical protein MPSEU_001042800 [Mayamaea pseudoterrestris]
MSDDQSDAPSDEAPSDQEERLDLSMDSAAPALQCEETEESRPQNELLRRRIYEYLLGKTISPGDEPGLQFGSNALNDHNNGTRSESSTLASDTFETPRPVPVRILSENKQSVAKRRSTGDDEFQSSPSHSSSQFSGTSSSGRGHGESDAYIENSNGSARPGDDSDGEDFSDETGAAVDDDGEGESESGQSNYSDDEEDEGEVDDEQSTDRDSNDIEGTEGSGDYEEEAGDSRRMRDDSNYHDGHFDDEVHTEEESHGRQQREYLADAPHVPEGYTESSEYDEEGDESERPDFMPGQYAREQQRSLQNLPVGNKPVEKRLSLSSHFSAQPAPPEDGFQLDNISLPSWQLHATDEASKAGGNGSSASRGSKSSAHEVASAASSSVLDNDDAPDSVGSHQKSRNQNRRESRDGHGRRTPDSARSSAGSADKPRQSESQRIEELADQNFTPSTPQSPPPMTPSKPMQKLHDAVAQSIPALDFRPTIPPPPGRPFSPVEPLHEVMTIDDKRLDDGQSSTASSEGEGCTSTEATEDDDDEVYVPVQSKLSAPVTQAHADHHFSKVIVQDSFKEIYHVPIIEKVSASMTQTFKSDEHDDNSETSDFDDRNNLCMGGRPSLLDSKRPMLDGGARPSESQRMLLFADAEPSASLFQCPESPPPTMPCKPMQKLSDAIAHDIPSGDFRPSYSPAPSAVFHINGSPTRKIDKLALTRETDLSPESARPRAVEADYNHDSMNQSDAPPTHYSELEKSSGSLDDDDAFGETNIELAAPADKNEREERSRRGFYVCFCFLILTLILMALALGPYFGLRVKNSAERSETGALNATNLPTFWPSSPPAFSPSVIPTYVMSPSIMPTQIYSTCPRATFAEVGGTIYEGDFSTARPSDSSNITIDFSVSDGATERVGFDVWYRLQGTNLYTTLRYCNEDGLLDTPWILTGDCQELLQDIRLLQPVTVSAFDDRCTDISFRSESNVEYKILLRSQFQRTSFYFYLMDNRFCDFASPLDSLNSITQRGYGTNGTSNEPPACGNSSYSGQGTWYKVQSTGSAMTISTCDSVLGTSNVAVYRGDCSSLQCVDSGSGNCDNQLNSFATIASAGSDESHLVYVAAEFEGIIGAVLVSVQETSNGTSNESTCADASPIRLGIALQDSVQTASLPVDSPEVPLTCTDDFGSLVTVQTSGSWYQFVGTGAQVILNVLCQDFTQSLSISVYRARGFGEQGCATIRCTTATNLGCSDSLEWLTKQGKPYYILFHAPTSQEVDVPFTFTLQSATTRRVLSLPHKQLRQP